MESYVLMALIPYTSSVHCTTMNTSLFTRVTEKAKVMLFYI